MALVWREIEGGRRRFALCKFLGNSVGDLVDAESGHEDGGEGEADYRKRAGAEFGVATGEMEVEGRAGQEGKHHALGDRAPEHELHGVAEDEEYAGEGDGQENAADFHPADAVLGIAILIDAKDAEGVGEHAGVGGGGAENGGVENDDGADEEKPEAPFAEGGAIHVERGFRSSGRFPTFMLRAWRMAAPRM